MFQCSCEGKLEVAVVDTQPRDISEAFVPCENKALGSGPCSAVLGGR